MSQFDSLLIQRYLEGGKVSVKSACLGGQVTCLSDAQGGHIEAYDACLRGLLNAAQAQVLLNDQPLKTGQVCSVGFDEKFEESISAAKFLKSIGMSDAEIRATLELFDLNKQSYLYCSQLSESACRQLKLVEALRGNHKILLLRDPFQPFNGRWREYFAKLILDEAVTRSRIVICTSVSFIPKLWSTDPHICNIDVGCEAQEAIQKARWEAEQREKSARERERDARAAEKLADAAGEPQSASITVPVPEAVASTFETTRDFIFEPFADISNFIRKHFLLGGTLASAAVLILMFTIMFPNLGALRAKLGSMHFNYSWKEIISSVTQSSAPKTAPSADQSEQLGEDEEQALEDGQEEYLFDPDEEQEGQQIALEPADPVLLKFIAGELTMGLLPWPEFISLNSEQAEVELCSETQQKIPASLIDNN